MVLTYVVTFGPFAGARNFWGGGDMDFTQNSVACLDGQSMIEMNNLAVGYFPSEAPQIGAYPPLTVGPLPEAPPDSQDSERNS
jgi:hypothetical protein